MNLSKVIARYHPEEIKKNADATLIDARKLIKSKKKGEINPKYIQIIESLSEKIEKEIKTYPPGVSDLKVIFKSRRVLKRVRILTEYIQRARGERHGKLRENVQYLLGALVLALILRIFVIQAYRIPTPSMENTLLVGDFLLVNKFIYGAKTPERIPLTNIFLPTFRFPRLRKPRSGDIIVFTYPKDRTKDYVKRCIAVEGQTVEVKNKELYVDNKKISENFILHKDTFIYDKNAHLKPQFYEIKETWGKFFDAQNWTRDNFGPVEVPHEKLFMLGDNRDDSSDSRFWGFLDLEDVKGQALIIYFSWDHNNFIPLYEIWRKIRFSRIGKIIR